MIDEVSVYDMKVFSTVILYISGNDAANGKNPEWIEEKFEELINLIKYSNNDCRVILYLLAPRGDVDVTRVNQSITKLANKWNNRSVEVSSECYDVFFKGGQLTHRYFNQDAMNRKCHLVVDFSTCAFNKGQRNSGRPRITEDFPPHSRGQYRNPNGQFNRKKIRCYG